MLEFTQPSRRRSEYCFKFSSPAAHLPVFALKSSLTTPRRWAYHGLVRDLPMGMADVEFYRNTLQYRLNTTFLSTPLFAFSHITADTMLAGKAPPAI